MTLRDGPPESAQPSSLGEKRICFFNTTPFWGGGEKWSLEMALGCRAKGHRVVVVAYPGSPLLDRARAEGLDAVGFAISNLSALRPVLLWKLKRFFQDRQIETVVFNGPIDVKAGGLSARAAGVEQRVYQRGIALGVKGHWLNRYLFTKVLTHIVVNSEATKTTLLENLREVVPAARVRVLYYGIDLDEFDQRPFTPLFERVDGEVLLGNVGRLTAQKGQDFLLEVASRLKKDGLEFRLLIAGDGELHADLTAKAHELGVQDDVDFLGFVEDVPSFLKGIDIFLLSSHWEGFGLVIAEANAAHTPVVAFDVSSNPEVIADGETGFLVPVGDLDSFAAHVRELIENEDLRTKMGEAARTHVEAKFQLQQSIDEFERYLWG